MARYIYCRKCGEKDTKFTSSEIHEGWRARRVFISAELPEGHGIRVNGEFTPLEQVVCDSCSKPVTGEIAVAVTLIPPGREIGNWEHEYGNVLTKEAVAVHDKATGREAVK